MKTQAGRDRSGGGPESVPTSVPTPRSTLEERERQYRAIFEASSDGFVINDLETGVVLEANEAFCRMHGQEDMTGMPPAGFVHPNSLHLFQQYMLAVSAGREFRCRAQDIRRDGTVFDIEVLGRGFVYHGRPALLGVVRDITQQLRAYQVLEERVAERTREIERRREVAEGLRDLLAVVNSRRGLDEVLDYVVEQARRLLGSDASAIFLPVEGPADGEAEGQLLGIRASSRLEAGFRSVRMPVQGSSTGLAYTSRRPVIASDLRAALPLAGGAGQTLEVEEWPSYTRVTRLPAELETPARDPRRRDAPDRGMRSFASGYGAFLAVPLAAQETTYGTLSLYFRHAHEFVDDEVALATAFADQAALAIENARLRAQAEQRAAEIERRREVAEGLRDLLAVVNSRRGLDEVLEYVVFQARRLLGSDASAIFFPTPAPATGDDAGADAGDDLLVIRASSGLETASSEVRMPLRRSATGRAFTDRRPVAISDLGSVLPVAFVENQGLEFEERRNFINVVRPRSLQAGDQSDAPEQPGQEAERIRRLRSFASGYGALLAVPLAANEESYGTLSLYFRARREFSEDEVALARAFADQTALAIENARLRAQAEQAAALEERQRLARELHDAVTQTLFAASLIADVVPDLWEIDPAEAHRRLEQLRRLTRGALAEMRILLVELRPGALTELPLADLLRQLADAAAGTTRVEVSLEVTGQRAVPLPAEVQVALYRVAQEALNNVAKHAQADHAVINLRYEADGTVQLTISDDGRGFDSAAIPAGHLGVSIMGERAAAIGARLRVESATEADSASQRGTTIEVVWPDGK